MPIEFTEPLLRALEAQRHSAAALTKRARFLDLLDASPGEWILDVGCGSGSFCRAVAPQVLPGGRVIGVDREAEAIDLATRLSAVEAATTLAFNQADGHDLPFDDQSFDAVVCISVLEFCEHPCEVLAEIRRVLRPGGRLLAANADEDTRVYNGHDRELGRRITRAIADRGRDPWLARRLASMLIAAGFHLEQETVLVDVEREFAPESSGYTHAHLWREYLLRGAGILAQDYDLWLTDLEACAQDGSYSYSVVTYAYLATR
jgi:ubiquinone/menaquinone biosynthesis C-methylase UbiE